MEVTSFCCCGTIFKQLALDSLPVWALGGLLVLPGAR